MSSEASSQPGPKLYFGTMTFGWGQASQPVDEEAPRPDLPELRLVRQHPCGQAEGRREPLGPEEPW